MGVAYAVFVQYRPQGFIEIDVQRIGQSDDYEEDIAQLVGDATGPFFVGDWFGTVGMIDLPGQFTDLLGKTGQIRKRWPVALFPLRDPFVDGGLGVLERPLRVVHGVGPLSKFGIVVGQYCEEVVKSESKSEVRLIDVGGLAELIEKERAVVEVDGRELALFYVDGQVFCIADRCPHAGGSLSCGRVEGAEVLCPRHGWRFDLVSGRCHSNPRFQVSTVPVIIDEGRAYLRIESSQE